MPHHMANPNDDAILADKDALGSALYSQTRASSSSDSSHESSNLDHGQRPQRTVERIEEGAGLESNIQHTGESDPSSAQRVLDTVDETASLDCEDDWLAEYESMVAQTAEQTMDEVDETAEGPGELSTPETDSAEADTSSDPDTEAENFIDQGIVNPRKLKVCAMRISDATDQWTGLAGSPYGNPLDYTMKCRPFVGPAGSGSIRFAFRVNKNKRNKRVTTAAGSFEVFAAQFHIGALSKEGQHIYDFDGVPFDEIPEDDPRWHSKIADPDTEKGEANREYVMAFEFKSDGCEMTMGDKRCWSHLPNEVQDLLNTLFRPAVHGSLAVRFYMEARPNPHEAEDRWIKFMRRNVKAQTKRSQNETAKDWWEDGA
ncbi:uncharacterized protein KY384_008175 [Bacidia gigantensis]|uniref:uncharacterized protein n=1 Tax=Bacidia gigantensis TaxID=2732470 RepID=UPI001D048A7C|nr:uncharacterized protein KY384_008175 [Bacidia gigantensis]KAG8526746.1 hypothetical protein KY384_008175 [Bacidia gigantensis]